MNSIPAQKVPLLEGFREVFTPRLTMTPSTLDDAAFMLALLNSKGWLTFIEDRNVHTVEEARTYLSTRVLGTAKNPNCGMYSIRLRETGEIIGTNSLVQRDFLDTVDIGYAFLDEHGGKGYATEATKAFLKYVHETLDYNHIVAFALTNHRASIRVLEKLDFTEKERLIDKDEECVLMEWSVN